MMRHSVIFIGVLFVFVACVKTNSVDCDNISYSCNTVEPFYSDMTLKLTLNNENIKVPLWVYEGEYDDTSHLVYFNQVSEEKISISLPLNMRYYAKVKYKSGDKTIYAIDGVFFKKYSKTECDSECWYIKNNIIDVRLK